VGSRVKKGYIALVLHCHLPFVRHPEQEEFLEEDWFFQAVTETYVPLLRVMERLEWERVPFRVTLSLSPTLCEMFGDRLLQGRCMRYLDRRLELLEKEVVRTRGTAYHASALMYREHFRDVRATYVDRYGCKVLEGFLRLDREGHVELITSAATHALLPLLATDAGRWAQVEAACRNFHKHFGRRPTGIWPPECAYEPEMGAVLSACGLQNFFVDSHAALLARPAPKAGVFRPFRTPQGLFAFARDVESSKQVWSRHEGYPGDVNYREFYRDIGYDADYDYIRPYLHADGVRRNVGIKYHRITGDVSLDWKQPYDPQAAARKADEHADDFFARRKAAFESLSPHVDGSPLVVASYDAELFGHRWLEGLRFLERLFRNAAADGHSIVFTTPSEYLRENPQSEVCAVSASSWGSGGYFETWINGSNDWIYPELHDAEERMVAVARDFARASGVLRRALNQCARELMLAQSSDWPFLLSVKSFDAYAAERVRTHLRRFNVLCDQIRGGQIQQGYLRHIEGLDNIFEELDYALFAGAGAAAHGPIA